MGSGPLLRACTVWPRPCRIGGRTRKDFIKPGRRVWLKGREKIAKRYLIHTAAFNLGLILRKLTGYGTPRGWVDAARAAASACAGWLRTVSRRAGLRNWLRAPFAGQTARSVPTLCAA